MNAKFFNFGLIAPLAAAGLLSATSLPAQAVDFTRGILGINYRGRFFNNGDPTTPADIWFNKTAGCEAIAPGDEDSCDFEIETALEHFNFINPTSDGQDQYLQYTLEQRPEIPVSGGAISLPSLCFDSAAFSTGVVLQDSTCGAGDEDLVAGPAGGSGVLQNILVANTTLYPDGNIPFLTVDINAQGPTAGEPVIDIFIQEVTNFSPVASGGGIVNTTVDFTAYAEKTFVDGSVVPLNGDGVFDLQFVLNSQQEAPGDITFVLAKEQVPEPSSLIGVAAAMGAGALTLRKRKSKV